MKKSTPYVIIPAIFLVLFILVLSSRLWLPDDRKNMTELYDQELILDNNFLKVNNARFDKHTNTLILDIVTGNNKNPGEKLVFFVCKDGDKNDLMEYEIVETDPASKKFEMRLFDVPEDFYYLSIFTGAISKNKLMLLEVNVDYRDTTTIDSSNIVYVYVTPTPEPATPTPTIAPYT